MGEDGETHGGWAVAKEKLKCATKFPKTKSRREQDRLANLAATLSSWLTKHGRKVRLELTPDQRDEARECFQMLDADGSGGLDVEELEDAFKMVGITIKRSAVIKMLRDLNVRENVIDYHTFEEMMMASKNHKDNDVYDSGDEGFGNGIPSEDGPMLSLKAVATAFRRKKLLEQLMEGGDARAALNNLHTKSQSTREELEEEEKSTVSKSTAIPCSGGAQRHSKPHRPMIDEPSDENRRKRRSLLRSARFQSHKIAQKSEAPTWVPKLPQLPRTEERAQPPEVPTTNGYQQRTEPEQASASSLLTEDMPDSQAPHRMEKEILKPQPPKQPALQPPSTLHADHILQISMDPMNITNTSSNVPLMISKRYGEALCSNKDLEDMSPAGVSSRRRVTDCPKMTPRVRSGRRVLTTHQNFVLGQPIYEPVRPIQELMPIQALQRSLDITAQSPSKRPLQSGTLLKTKSVGTETLNRHCKLPPSRHLVGEKCESLGALTYRR